MAQQYQLITKSCPSNSCGNHKLSTGLEIHPQKRLDSVPHLSENVTAIDNLTLSQAINPMENIMNLRLLSIDQVCKVLGLGRVKVYELINQKQLSTVTIGTRRLISTRALYDFINQLEERRGT